MAVQQSIEQKLQDYLPDGALPVVLSLFAPHTVQIRITKPRRTKLGDYRPPDPKRQKHPCHRISINNNLNQFAFLTTLLHELAHLTTWENHKNSVKPHGQEWKAEFKGIMEPIFKVQILPNDVCDALLHYMANPKASSCSDQNLSKVLRNYDEPSNSILLEDLPENSVFALNRNRVFRKGPQLRKRFKCLDLNNRRYYLVSPMAEVELIPDPESVRNEQKKHSDNVQLRLFGHDINLFNRS